MTRISCLALWLVLSVCGCEQPAGVTGDGDGSGNRLDSSASRKPNILILVADDLGFNDLAINNGNTTVHTPNMDQLAREGVRFTRRYASAVCSPARAALLTGLYPELPAKWPGYVSGTNYAA